MSSVLPGPNPAPKPVLWMGASLEDLRTLPDSVRRDAGRALNAASEGGTPPTAKVLKGFGGASVLELRIWDERKNTYRAVYTVKFSTGVYVLHVFQKKSKKGVETSKHDVERIKRRLKMAETEHKARLAARSGQGEEKQ